MAIPFFKTVSEDWEIRLNQHLMRLLLARFNSQVLARDHSLVQSLTGMLAQLTAAGMVLTGDKRIFCMVMMMIRDQETRVLLEDQMIQIWTVFRMEIMVDFQESNKDPKEISLNLRTEKVMMKMINWLINQMMMDL